MNNVIFNVNVIKSKSNETVMEISKLSNKKYRAQKKLFLCDGIKLFTEAVKFGAKIKYIVLDNNVSFSNELLEMVEGCVKKGAKILCVEEYVFVKMTSESSPQGIIAVCEFLEHKHRFFANVENDYIKDKRIMILESVRDPGNMGAIFRNAVALGIDRLIISSDCVDIYSPKVVRASMGAFFKIDVDIVDDLVLTINKIKGFGRRVLAAALKERSLILGKHPLSCSDVVVLGNEGHGIDSKTIEACTDTIFIPMRENTESLNVAIASAIIMWEISK